jgi:hypothetical protein
MTWYQFKLIAFTVTNLFSETEKPTYDIFFIYFPIIFRLTKAVLYFKFHAREWIALLQTESENFCQFL